MPDESQANAEYPYKDWIADWAWYGRKTKEFVARGLQPDSPEVGVEYTSYFRDKYGPTADYRGTRLGAALTFFLRHVDELNEGSIAIAAKEQAVSGKPLVIALWRMYSIADEVFLGKEPQVCEVLQLAREAERLLKSGEI